MDKLEKVIEVTKPIAKEAAKKAAPVISDAAKKSVPVIAGAAKKTGKATVKAGSAVIDGYKRKREEKDQALIEEFKQRYPQCQILLSKFDPDNKMGYRKMINWDCAYEIYDEYHTPQYRIIGNLESEFAQRRLKLYNNRVDVAGVVVERGILHSHVSIKWGSDHFMDVKYRNGYYYFSDSNYYCGGQRYTLKPSLCCSGRVLMERSNVKDHELLVIVDPEREEECLLIYAAMKLAISSRPDYGGGGE